MTGEAMLISATRATTLKLANQREAAAPRQPVLMRGAQAFDLPAALAVADPALDMQNPLKGPFKALPLGWETQARAALEVADLDCPILGSLGARGEGTGRRRHSKHDSFQKQLGDSVGKPFGPLEAEGMPDAFCQY